MARQAKPARKPGSMKIKKGDTVIVLAGRDRGREGLVIAVYPDRQRVLVQGVNIIRKNTKVNYQGRQGAKQGGIVTQEAPIHVSNVALIDPDSKKAARAGYRITESDGTRTKTRISRQGGKDI